jgi:hypothetical protein
MGKELGSNTGPEVLHFPRLVARHPFRRHQWKKQAPQRAPSLYPHGPTAHGSNDGHEAVATITFDLNNPAASPDPDATCHTDPRGSAVERLNSVVDELIKENRTLKRQLDQLATKATGATGNGIERGLRSIQRRVERALSGSSARKTRRTTTRRGTGARRRRTTAKKAAAE